jgi:hypothetical protein
VVHSETVLAPNEWVNVVVERVMGRLRLTVNSLEVERRESVDTTDAKGAISIGTPLMIGGTSPGTKLPVSLQSVPSFAGCINDPVRQC